MVLGVRGLGVSWLRPGQSSWSVGDSADVAQQGTDRRGSELGWARSSEPVSAETHVQISRKNLKENIDNDTPVHVASIKAKTHKEQGMRYYNYHNSCMHNFG